MKRCPACQQDKELSEFPKNKRLAGGIHRICKICNAANARRWRLKYPDRRRASSRRNWLKGQYGLTVEQYESMLKRQKGRCAICGKPPAATRRHAIDHDHATGKIRSLLCSGCNVSLAHLENHRWYAKAVSYLKRHHPERYAP